MSEQPPSLPLVPRVYANGIGLGFSKTECVITFMFGNEALVATILPLPAAKSLSNALNQLVSDYEKKFSHPVPLIEELIPDEPKENPSN